MKETTQLYDTLYLLTSEDCHRCPHAKMVLEEVSSKIGVSLKIEDIDNIDEDINFNMLENQIFLTSTPSLIGEKNGNMKIIDISTNLNPDYLERKIQGIE